MSVHTLSTYTVHLQPRSSTVREHLSAFRDRVRARAELQSVLAGDLGAGQRDDAVRAFARNTSHN